MAVPIRRAVAADAEAVAAVYLAARHAAVPAIPPLVHPDDAVRTHLAEHVVGEQAVHVAEVDGRVVGFVALTPGWIEHLYVHPDHCGGGIGAALLVQATAVGGPLQLWTFAANDGARRFHARHGFAEVGGTDGDNEEGAPDVLRRWDPGAGRR